jgi:pre-60S factor REI1
MPTITCNACNAAFEEEEDQRLHYRSEWHRYNLKRKVYPSYSSAASASVSRD